MGAVEGWPRWRMDLLAPILAYLGSVTAIIVAVVMSYDAFIYAPLHAPLRHYSPTVVVMPSAAKSGAKATRQIARLGSRAAEPVHGGLANFTAAPQAEAAANRRAARKQIVMVRRRRLARQARDKQWAYQQAAQTFGYADEPPAGFGFDRYQ
jgi:hypothetical protein